MSAMAFPIAGQKIIRATPTPLPAPLARPRAVVLPAALPSQIAANPGEVEGNVYRNRSHGFEISFPDNWLITGDDFGDYMRSRGFDLSLKAPEVLSLQNKTQLDRALKNVTVLLTAFRSLAGSPDNAILRVSIEDLSLLPQVKDAVDYFDMMRSQFATMTLPADFKYSDTQAEKLGRKQFAFIDTNTEAGKKRLYATVKNRHAIMFTLSYRTDDDLVTMRQILAAGNFNIK